MDVVQRQFQEIAPQLAGFFWHGVGRGFYFSREHFLPVLSSASSSVEEEVHNCADRKSAMAGLAWAVTVVNMRQPAIMENILRRQTGQLSLADAFTNGVISSIIMRQDTTPGQPFTSAFCQYRPEDQRVRVLWERLISLPCALGLNEYYPVLKQHRALDQIFKFTDLPLLVAHLGRQPQPSSSAAWSPGVREGALPILAQ
jgi:hypothetical protein